MRAVIEHVIKRGDWIFRAKLRVVDDGGGGERGYHLSVNQIFAVSFC